MSGHSPTRARLWIVATLAVLVIAVHGSVFYYASSHLTLSAGVIAGIVALVVIKHLGLLGPAFTAFRRHRRKP
jgi:hypothetical protein